MDVSKIVIFLPFSALSDMSMDPAEMAMWYEPRNSVRRCGNTHQKEIQPCAAHTVTGATGSHAIAITEECRPASVAVVATVAQSSSPGPAHVNAKVRVSPPPILPKNIETIEYRAPVSLTVAGFLGIWFNSTKDMKLIWHTCIVSYCRHGAPEDPEQQARLGAHCRGGS
jgi:hypothetical protein